MSKRHIKGDPVPEVSLPITPMLDMTFQLLFFFILTFNPNRLIEGQDLMAVPPVEAKTPPKAAADRPENVDPREPSTKNKELEKPPEIEQEFFVRIKADSDSVCTLYFRERENGEGIPVGTLKLQDDADTIKTKKALKATVGQAREAKVRKIKEAARALPEKDRNETIEKEIDRVVITVEPDRNTPWMFPVAVQDICEQAGFKRDRILFAKPAGVP
jgi:biopolymer transport protein ExbD